MSTHTYKHNRKMITDGDGASCVVSPRTAPLFFALQELDIRRGDNVAVSTYSCSALLNAVYMAGAEAWVFDVRRETIST